MLICRWCGEIYDDAEHVDRTPNGFWCDCCDGFTFYNPEDEARHRLLLLLEDKLASSAAPTRSNNIPKFRKQLSPLRYPGGKSKLIDYLYTRISPEKRDTFVEVFAGGASLGLALLDAGKINRLVLNDIDPGVYAFWRTVLEHPQELVSRLQGPNPTHLDLIHAKELLSKKGAPPPDLAWAFLLSNRLSFSGITKANPLGGKNGTHEALLSRWNPKKLEERILHIHSMKDKIEVYNEDACQFLLKYAYWRIGSTCFIDPPYFEQGPKLYNYFYKEKDHEELAELVQSLYSSYPEADLIITYDNHPRIRELYPCAEQEIVWRKYSCKN